MNINCTSKWDIMLVFIFSSIVIYIEWFISMLLYGVWHIQYIYMKGRVTYYVISTAYPTA